jgi:hypothetical protein
MQRSKPRTGSASVEGIAVVIVAAMLAGASGPARAQGGPPMVTDDPDTVPIGHWEINLAAIGTQVPGLRQLSLPDADINYGLSEHTQLKLDTPWLLSKADGAGVQSGLGGTDLGLRWRFIDRARAGFAMSIYPQVLVNALPGSYRRGLTAAGSTWFLPIEASTEIAGFGVDGEVGRYLASSPLTRALQPDAWAAGLILSRECLPELECLAEIRNTIAPHDVQTLINLGGRRKLNDALTLLFALGHDFGPAAYDHQELLFYLGVQVTR